MEATLPITAGKLMCRHIRNFLERCKFEGRNIQYLETKGFIENEFIVKGNSDDLKYIMACIRNHPAFKEG